MNSMKTCNFDVCLQKDTKEYWEITMLDWTMDNIILYEDVHDCTKSRIKPFKTQRTLLGAF